MIELSWFYGPDLDRKALVEVGESVDDDGVSYYTNEFYVTYYHMDDPVKKVKMVSEDGTAHSEYFANDAAENWCTGILNFED